jgi:hypothetical protein
MTFKLQAQAGSRRRSCGVTPRTISGMPSSTERDEWGACTFFGTVPLLPLARVDGHGVARPCLAAVIEGRPGDIPARSDLSRSFTLSGQRSSRMAPYGAHRGLEASMVYPASAELQSASHWSRNLGNQGAVEVRPHRPRQNKGAASLTKAHGAFRKIGEAVNRQGTLTITGWQCASGH